MIRGCLRVACAADTARQQGCWRWHARQKTVQLPLSCFAQHRIIPQVCLYTIVCTGLTKHAHSRRRAAPNKAQVHAQAAVHARAREADVDTIRYGRPGWILRWAIKADLPEQQPSGVSSCWEAPIKYARPKLSSHIQASPNWPARSGTPAPFCHRDWPPPSHNPTGRQHWRCVPLPSTQLCLRQAERSATNVAGGLPHLVLQLAAQLFEQRVALELPRCGHRSCSRCRCAPGTCALASRRFLVLYQRRAQISSCVCADGPDQAPRVLDFPLLNARPELQSRV